MSIWRLPFKSRFVQRHEVGAVHVRWSWVSFSIYLTRYHTTLHLPVDSICIKIAKNQIELMIIRIKNELDYGIFNKVTCN